MEMNHNQKAFFALLRAGLWEKEVSLLPLGDLDYSVVQQLAEEQSVVGLIAAGMEHVSDTKIPKLVLLQFIGQTLQIEEQNKAMNYSVGALVDKMRSEGIETLLVKGQGLAQCYERPLWRTSGDVDFLFSKESYYKAKVLLSPLNSFNSREEHYSKHFGMIIDSWLVEIHGNLRSGLSNRVDKTIDDVQNDLFLNGHFRSWMNGNTQVFLPEVNSDIFLVYTHFIKHFYKEGMTIRQVCDWCRLLWKYKDDVEPDVLEKWLRKANLLTEWRAFAALAIKYLEMPVETMPLYDDAPEWERKADSVCSLLLQGYSGKKLKDTFRVMKIIPSNTLRFLPGILLNVNMLKIKERIVGV